MSQVLINQYLAELDRLKKIGGTQCESLMRDPYQDKKSKEPTIRTDRKEEVIKLPARVGAVCVETMQIVDAMRGAQR